MQAVQATTAGTQDQRHVLAERYKCKMCRNYLVSGECPYEFRCMFAHGDHELRTMEMNLKDGLITEEAIKSYQRVVRARDRDMQQQQNRHTTFPFEPSAVEPLAPRFAHNPYSVTNIYTYLYDDDKSDDVASEDAASPVNFKADPSVLEP